MRMSRKAKNARKRSMVALYGNIALERAYCRNCDSSSFIKADKFVCCGSPAPKVPAKFYRESDAPERRKQPPKREQRLILAEQNLRCYYCLERFGTLKFRVGTPIILSITWDHQVPYAFSCNNESKNFVAACQVCNGIKSDHIFKELEEARSFIKNIRRAKGYDW